MMWNFTCGNPSVFHCTSLGLTPLRSCYEVLCVYECVVYIPGTLPEKQNMTVSRLAAEQKVSRRHSKMPGRIGCLNVPEDAERYSHRRERIDN